MDIELTGGKKVYFASDFHLGTPSAEISRIREKKIVRWLDTVSTDAACIFLLGDQFDFWFEYKYLIPKGYTRFLGKLAELREKNIEIYFFTGNHDMWMFDYFPSELNIPVIRRNLRLKVNNTIFLIGHGDGLGPGDYKYKFLKTFFNSSICQRLFAFVHPWIGFSIATKWSQASRKANTVHDEEFLGEKERIWIFCKETEKREHHDYYIFGHRHLLLDLPVGEKSRYINLGEWLTGSHYGSFDGNDFDIKLA